MLLSGCEVHGAGLAEPFGRRSLEKAPPDSLPEDRARWNWLLHPAKVVQAPCLINILWLHVSAARVSEVDP